MLYYVAHCYEGNSENLRRAAAITHDLQVDDPDNCYICPLLTFSHLRYGELGYRAEMDLCLDLLMVCDGLIVASGLSKGVYEEIQFAEMVGLEIEYLR